MKWRVVSVVAVAGLLAGLAGACSDTDESTKAGSTKSETGDEQSSTKAADGEASDEAGAATKSGDSPWTVVPGVQVVTVTGAEPKEPLTLFTEDGDEVMTVKADEFGQLAVPYAPTEPLTIQAGPNTEFPAVDGSTLTPGVYEFRDTETDTSSGTFEVLSIDDVAPESFYSQQVLTGAKVDVFGKLLEGDLLDGFQYITMRDGVKLSAMVRFPDPTLYGPGPYPTLIEYSGYGVSNPDGEEPGSRIMRALGYATVGVNMRGTGCSGGVFDVFSPAQQADGYDVVEAVAAQDWVLNNKVGMVGLSYSGIGQLYTASTQPPHLAAITPQSVIADPWLEQWPGGVYNAGFTKQWLDERDRQAAPGGQSWTDKIIEGGDKECDANQKLRNVNINFESFGKALTTRPQSADDRDLRQLVTQITVPTFITGAFQDEQTGPQFAEMLDNFTSAPVVKIGLWNGRHPDGYAGTNVGRLYEFLELYVANRVPKIAEIVRGPLATELAKNFESTDTEVGPDRFVAQFGDDVAGARVAYEAEPAVWVMFESGANTVGPTGNEVGEPGGTFTRTYTQWPPAEATTQEWFFGAGGKLATTSQDTLGADSFAFDGSGAGLGFFKDDEYPLLARLWDFDWTQFPQDSAVSYETEPLAEDLLLAGPAQVDLWVSANAVDADVQATLTEIRPDGVEYALQTGWLRLAHRAEDAATTDGLEVGRTYSKEDLQELDPGEWTEAKITLPSVGAPIRAGSKLRITISNPGRDRGEWKFETDDYAAGPAADGPSSAEPVRYQISYGGGQRSALRVTVAPAGDIPRALPPCPSLRGQACRPALARTNSPGELPGG